MRAIGYMAMILLFPVCMILWMLDTNNERMDR